MKIDIKALDGEFIKTNDEPTCLYYISIHQQNNFYEPICELKNTCRGRCKEVVRITNLKANQKYDVKIKAAKDYGEFIFTNIQTSIINK